MKRLPIACFVFAVFCWLPAGAYAKNCSGLPTSFNGNQFPTGNFFSNFNNSCYLIPFSTGNGSGSEQGDLNSVYNKLFFNACPTGAPATSCINPDLPPYELIILGEFPNSRYFSVGLYDNHSASTQNITDVNIVPLTSNDINPYEPGVAFVSGQQYGATVYLGGTPGTLQTGCMMTGYNFESNWMDGTQRHPYMNWNLDTPFFQQNPTYPLHQVDTPEHTNPNTAGVVIIRSYLDLTAPTSANQPHVIVRDVASGCAYPAAYVTDTMNVVTTNSTTGNGWQTQQQVQEHNFYANWQSTECWGAIGKPYTTSDIHWLRQDEYVAGANPDSAYLIANIPAGFTETLSSANEVLRLRFQVPTTPPTPCVNGCSRSGNEQMRYLSISFQITGGGTLASLPDSCPVNPLIACTPLIQDPNGYVTLLVGTGVPQPTQATAANGYTWLDLSKIANYTELNEIAIRDILPSSWFNCGAQVVPYKVGEATTGDAGLMGYYAPLTDTPPVKSLPATASPLSNLSGFSSACDTFPIGPPAIISPSNQQCSVLLPNPIMITAVTSYCANSLNNPNCNQFIVQSNPPIAISGQGFGSFPLGLPYTGNSNFLEITDITQTPNWSAGSPGSPCTVTIGEWSDSLISLIANVNQNGACPMAAGDTLSVTVLNPQDLSSIASLGVTVNAQSGSPRKP
jgi:hypothetical protein